MNDEAGRENFDQTLAETGRQWRAAQPEPVNVDPGAFLPWRAQARNAWGSRPRSSRVWAPAAVGIAAVIAAVLVPLALQRGGDPIVGPQEPGAAPQPSLPILPPDQGAGVPVEGTGTLFRDGSGPIKLCSQVTATLDLPTSLAGCSPVAVVTTGVDASLLVHTTTGGQAYSDPVRVEGTYRDGILSVSRVAKAQPDPPGAWVEPPIPCAPPAGGWAMGYGLPAQDDGSAANGLIAFVRSHPDRYLDLWEGHPDGPPSDEASYAPTRMVYVVGTTGDVSQARSELSAIYPGNLCVHKVRYTMADLERMAQLLTTVEATPIEAEPDVIQNKVRVKVVALDPPTVAILAGFRDALVIEEPLLQWLD
jgi:hypothetical protein